jgi:hypothetical protein
MLLHIKCMENSQWENRNHLFCLKYSVLTYHHCQCRGVGQGMKHTLLYLWYPLFQAQWDRYDQCFSFGIITIGLL